MPNHVTTMVLKAHIKWERAWKSTLAGKYYTFAATRELTALFYVNRIISLDDENAVRTEWS